MNYAILTSLQLSQQLRSLRKARGLSQSDLGIRMGLSQSRIARMENSPTQISVDALLQLLSALGVNLVLSDPATSTQPSARLSTAPQDADSGDW